MNAARGNVILDGQKVAGANGYGVKAGRHVFVVEAAK